jgi:hypothetical protein
MPHRSEGVTKTEGIAHVGFDLKISISLSGRGLFLIRRCSNGSKVIFGLFRSSFFTLVLGTYPNRVVNTAPVLML